ncbi:MULTISPECIES: LodA/GoxA family CTQ-dependent oxidase [unclassified Moorena]|uniref:LodA/GoxA family CTQ-dependent oxidase n=1 Tax=unclassified Moorena TaxID=2683338 RepID=UPI0013CD48AB|nr:MULTISPECIES: LodA/GoxA family CTQ-dependent oxidase [unclassified Moorena]NEO18519.1 hypothetical protein [Moorena sp. SIO4A5]NEQ59047.1 hypothetical protein [Moorena sp. SIO4A1]
MLKLLLIVLVLVVLLSLGWLVLPKKWRIILTGGKMVVKYKIQPAIGIARVGNSEEYYLEPETRGGLPIKTDRSPFEKTDFRDGKGKLRRQAARFRLYQYTYSKPDGKLIEVIEVTQSNMESLGISSIDWTVHLANKKASWYEFQTMNGENGYASNHPLRNKDYPGDRTNLFIDFGPRSLSLNSLTYLPSQAQEFDENSKPAGYPSRYPSQDLYDGSSTTVTISSLGKVLIDSESRLIVVGGYGKAGSSNQNPEITDYANNDDWWDDTSDGPVSATITFTETGKAPEEASPAWVLVGPPAYAPQIVNMIALYDTIFDVAVREMEYRPDIYEDSLWKKGSTGYKADFQADIKPILDHASMMPWVVAIPRKPHTFDTQLLGNPSPEYNGLRAYFFDQIRAPDQKNTLKSPKTGYPMMPYLAGDDATGSSQKSKKYLTLTDTQYFMLQQWVEGYFENTTPPTPQVADPGEELTRASLENCVGGAFSPGIEMTWISRNPKIYSEPFRIKKKAIDYSENKPLSLGMNLDEGVEPGDITKFMALPWQADFNECSIQPLDRIVWWWPAQRPYFVYPDLRDGQVPIEELKDNQMPWVGTDYDQNASDYVMFPNDIEMVQKWHELGFVLEVSAYDDWDSNWPTPYYAEVARNLARD